MNILNTHYHRLIFYIDIDISKNGMNKWKKIKNDCENGDNKYIVEHMKYYYKLNTNKNLPYLNRCEGGIGGNDNNKHKQIRFRSFCNGQYLNGYNFGNTKIDNNIMFNEIISNDIDKWTYEELDDLIYAFIKTINYYISGGVGDCISGYIEMRNKNCMSDNYLDSDTETDINLSS